MKELSIEEKARRYDESMDRAKKELNAFGSQDCEAAKQIFRLFPELAESEDERIRKWLIDTIKSVPNDSIEWDVIDKSDVLAWLEKQGEQKSSWSDEDKKMLVYALDMIERYSVIDKSKSRQVSNWLKSLRPHNNSVTDEELVQAKKDAYSDALDKIEYHSGNPTFDDGWSAAIWYLKKRNALPQNRWKPSDEMLEALYRVIPENVMEKSENEILLDKLYQGLKYGRVLSKE